MYNDFLKRGELFSLAPNLTGEWKKDEKEFTKIYVDLYESIVNDIDYDDFEDTF